MKSNPYSFLLFVLLGTVGCGSKKDKDKQAVTPPPQPGVSSSETDKEGTEEPPAVGLLDYSSVTIPASLEPDKVVVRFMDAIRLGNALEAEALMTDKARKAATENDMSVQPNGAPSSDYRLGKTSYGSDGVAHVESSWTEPKGFSRTVTYNVVWKLRKQESGWRIAGFAAEVDGGVFTYLDFENPAEMMREYKRAERRLAAQPKDDPPARNATLPFKGGTLR